MSLRSNTFKSILLEENFTVYYQPKYALADGKLKISGAEALLRRKRSPSLPIMPFIEDAERNNSIGQLTVFVANKIVHDMDALHGLFGEYIKTSINISPTIVNSQGDFFLVRDIFKKSKIPTKYIEFEITEGLHIKEEMSARKILLSLREDGFFLALDDFGVGLSSFHRLDYLPVTTVKLDKYFVEGIGKRKSSEIITNNVIRVAKEIGISAVAEGVEEQHQLDFVINAGYTEIQGFLLGRPMNLKQFADTIQHQSLENNDAQPHNPHQPKLATLIP